MENHLDFELLICKQTKSIKTTAAYTILALIAFAANSVLCRLALGENSIDAQSFTVIRSLSCSIVLLFIFMIRNNKQIPHSKGSWSASFMLFLYATSFSFAYITLDTGTGALILFGAVQITMIFLSIPSEIDCIFQNDSVSLLHLLPF